MIFCKPKAFFPFAGLLGLSVAAHATESAATIRVEVHHCAPLTLIVPAGQPLTIQVVHASKKTFEFESFKLNRQKAISPGEERAVRLPAPSLGSHDSYDDFHQNVPAGSIVAK